MRRPRPARHQDPHHRPGLALAERLYRIVQRLRPPRAPRPQQLYTLSEARVVISGWIDDYNAYRPHGALGYLTPDELMGAEPAL